VISVIVDEDPEPGNVAVDWAVDGEKGLETLSGGDGYCN